MKTFKIAAVLTILLTIIFCEQLTAGAVTGSRNKCYSVGKRFNASASLRYFSNSYYTDRQSSYDCYFAGASTITYNGGYAYAQTGLYVSTQRITVSKWNAIAGNGYTIPLTEPPDSYGNSSGNNGEYIEFDSVNHTIQLSGFSGYIASTLGTNYGSTLMYVIWIPESESDTVININEVISKGKVSIENGFVNTSGFFSQSDFITTVQPDSLNPFFNLKVSPAASLTKTIDVPNTVNLNNVMVTVFSEGGYGTFNEQEIIFPEVTTLTLRMFIEGYYDSGINSMRRGDTVKVYFYESLIPYMLIDSAVSVIDSNGYGNFYLVREDPCCRTIKTVHKSSIQTWSSDLIDIGSNHLFYDFTNSVSKAYGNNMVQVDSAPLAFAVYSGDINQDGTIDASDVSDVDNAAYNSVSGYTATDVTGDDYVDAQDVSIVDNNSYNSVSVINP